MSIIQPFRDMLTVLRAIRDALQGNAPAAKQLAREATLLDVDASLVSVDSKLVTGQTTSAAALSVVLPSDYNTSLFGDFRTVELTPNINLKSIYGNPNLPIAVHLANGGTAAAMEAFVGGRQYSIRGRVAPAQRQTTQRRLGAVVGGALIPLVSLRRKAAYRSASIKLAQFEVITTAELLVEVRFNPVLTGAVFGTPTNTLATETAVQSDTSATVATGGVLVTSALIAANTRQSESVNRGVLPEMDIPADGATEGTVTLLAYAPGGGPATVSAILKITEEW